MDRTNFHTYQDRAYNHVLRHPAAGLLLDMGLGKTIATLTAVQDLLNCCEVLKPLVVAPRLVAETTWTGERDTWEHTRGLRVSRIIGTRQQRLNALAVAADVYVISRDNIKWLVETLGSRWDFDMLVLDESSSFKNRASERFRAVKKVRGRCCRVVILTGTPAPNGLMDLWAQIYLLDEGERLGRTLGGFRERYFKPGKSEGHIVYDWVLRDGAEESIYAKISDICISMQASDWLDLPERQDIVERLSLGDAMEGYKAFKKTELLRVAEGDAGVITPVNAAGLYNKLLQFCNGAVYDESGAWHLVSDAKLDALEERIEALQGRPVIVFYSFKSDVERIQARIKKTRCLLGSGDVADWNAGKIEVLLAHPASTGHGLNLQAGGRHMIWFGLPWSLELYQQAVARLHRQGQSGAVVNLALICAGTVEELVFRRLVEKSITQEALLAALRD